MYLLYNSAVHTYAYTCTLYTFANRCRLLNSHVHMYIFVFHRSLAFSLRVRYAPMFPFPLIPPCDSAFKPVYIFSFSPPIEWFYRNYYYFMRFKVYVVTRHFSFLFLSFFVFNYVDVFLHYSYVNVTLRALSCEVENWKIRASCISF